LHRPSPKAFFSANSVIDFYGRPPALNGSINTTVRTIRQQGIYGTHVKKSFTLPEDYSHPDAAWSSTGRSMKRSTFAMEYPRGPVHINAPFREPLYPPKFETIRFSKKVRTIDRRPAQPVLSESERKQLVKSLPSFDKILIVAGQND